MVSNVQQTVHKLSGAVHKLYATAQTGKQLLGSARCGSLALSSLFIEMVIIPSWPTEVIL